MDILKKAKEIYDSIHGDSAKFERALFLSWYCGKGDCAFCYMSTQKHRIKDPKKSRRSPESVFAEAIISKACGWEIEFLSGGYDSYDTHELAEIARGVKKITGKKQWLNIGTLSKVELEQFKNSSEGYIGTLECVNPKIRKKICPSKPLTLIKETFKACDELGFKKGITVIIGLGEHLDDFPYLEKFIKEHGISRVTFYSLNPQAGTIFKTPPEIEYYELWVAKTRIAFPKLYIVAGAWYDKTDYYGRLLLAGANSITKFPTIKMFGTDEARALEESVRMAGRRFMGTMTVMPKIDVDRIGLKVRPKVVEYLKKMQSNL